MSYSILVDLSHREKIEEFRIGNQSFYSILKETKRIVYKLSETNPAGETTERILSEVDGSLLG